eukprot:CAMPEP_0172549360 /NCGR_PEP_ID=MMETSP1067-20121228/18477_1 /TAXON_ID=265564 ORGANISM="Thalassiosira punctigera, Strain Tpunct2005C2" /NCGR_SAMPLE_ID=MMETSP1067 /ASSEMBLY_ACC=CAM_ASM_000444 /LENGTH=115 /DNA_ID=CAMNT_0013336739 /DNA_START=536 /DNA_END=883 /DNA_ORIENTATION=+
MPAKHSSIESDAQASTDLDMRQAASSVELHWHRGHPGGQVALFDPSPPRLGVPMGSSWSLLLSMTSRFSATLVLVTFLSLAREASITTVTWVVRGVAWNVGMDAASSARRMSDTK